jgi:hypothetical protein
MTNNNSSDRCTRCQSYDINPNQKGRDNTRLDLCDVCYWRDRAETAEKRPERGQLALDVYMRVCVAMDSHPHEEAESGDALADILGVILSGGTLSLSDPFSERECVLLDILQDLYPPEHALWSIIYNEHRMFLLDE